MSSANTNASNRKLLSTTTIQRVIPDNGWIWCPEARSEHTVGTENILLDEQCVYHEVDLDDEDFQKQFGQSTLCPPVGDCAGFCLEDATKGQKVTVIRREEILSVSSERQEIVAPPGWDDCLKCIMCCVKCYCCCFLCCFRCTKCCFTPKTYTENEGRTADMYISAKRYEKGFVIPVPVGQMMDVTGVIVASPQAPAANAMKRRGSQSKLNASSGGAPFWPSPSNGPPPPSPHRSSKTSGSNTPPPHSGPPLSPRQSQTSASTVQPSPLSESHASHPHHSSASPRRSPHKEKRRSSSHKNATRDAMETPNLDA